jgi:hypothetical protein
MNEIGITIASTMTIRPVMVCAAASPGTNHASLGLQVKRMFDGRASRANKKQVLQDK